MKIYKTLIRPVVTYGAETWSILAGDANKLRIFERKIIRRIWGPVNENGHYRIRTNLEIECALENEDIVRFIKSQRMRWLGHVERMMSDRMPKKIYSSSMNGKRRKGRPRSRWLDEVEKDLKCLNKSRWKIHAADRNKWRNIVKQAKAHPGL